MQGRKKTVVIMGLLMAVLLANGGSMLYAHLGENPEEHAARIRSVLTEKLDLDEAQQKELETVVTELGKKRKEMRDFHLESRDELLSILRAENIDRSRVDQLIAEHKDRVEDLLAVVSNQLVGFAETLSKEQRERLAQTIEDLTAFGH